jgi:ABC-type uncharacterized transport system fused permease/ATPase subunit
MEAEYRSAHQHVIANSEEIAFHRSKKEKHIINWVYLQLFKQKKYNLSMYGLIGGKMILQLFLTIVSY